MSNIPPIIHLAYFPWCKDQKLKADQHDFDHRPYENMVRYAPDFEVKLWDYYTTEAFCLEHYPEIWKVAAALPRPMMLVNTLRWLIMYHFGGVSWQYDMNPLVPMGRMLPSPGRECRVFTEFVLTPEQCMIRASEPIRNGEPEESVRIPSQVFSATPRHRFIKATVDFIHERSKTLSFQRDYDCQFITGNAAASTAYDRFGKGDPTVERIGLAETRRMIQFIPQGTWRTEDRRQKSEVGSQRSLVERGVQSHRSVLKDIPAVRSAFHRFIRPHVHETGLTVLRASCFVLRDTLAEALRDAGVRSVLECTPNGRSVLEGEGAPGMDWRVTSPVRHGSNPNRNLNLNPNRTDYDCDYDYDYDYEGNITAPRVSFLNPMYSRLPRVDAVLLPDYFDQIPNADIRRIIHRVQRAGIRWLLATHYPCLNRNWDTYVGEWRPINLTLPPYSFPEPEASIPDPDAERRPDRSLGLWRMEAIGPTLWLVPGNPPPVPPGGRNRPLPGGEREGGQARHRVLPSLEGIKGWVKFGLWLVPGNPPPPPPGRGERRNHE